MSRSGLASLACGSEKQLSSFPQGRLSYRKHPFHLRWFAFAVLSILLTSVLGQDTTLSTSIAPSASASTAATGTSIRTLPTTFSLPALDTARPTYQIDLPQVSSLFVTLNLCSLGSNTSIIPSAILSTASPPNFALGRSVWDSSSGGITIPNQVSRNGDPWELGWSSGFANWTYNDPTTSITPSLLVGLGIGDDGSVDTSLISDDNGKIVVQISISIEGASQSLSPSSLLLGDTTQNSVLLLSPLLLEAPIPQPSYPNYTLPGAQLTFDTLPGSSSETNLTSLSPDLQLVIVPTESSPTNDGLDNSLCAVRSANTSTGFIADPRAMLVNATTRWMDIGGFEGYRTMWVVGDLTPQTNYTAWVVDDQGGMGQPIWFSTKEAAFPCQLVLPNAICPGIAYAAPLTANLTKTTLPGSTSAVPFPIATLPDSISDVLSTSLGHFSTSILSSACGRDLFSHVSTCLDCYNSYRDWLCRTVVPQCASSTTGTGLIAPQTIQRTTDDPREAGLDTPYAYTQLKPCLSICNRADRDCPVFLEFRCPRRHVNGNATYAYLGLEVDEGDGSQETGPAALDRWGNRWCNG